MEIDAYIEMSALEENHWWFVGRRKILQAIISSLNLTRDARILELGSGTGGNFSLLSRYGRLTAVEKEDIAREISRGQSADVEIIAGELPNNISLPRGKFDLICLFDVLEHIEDDVTTMRLVKDLLAQDGVAMITVPAYKALYGPHDIKLHHKRRYEANELRKLLLQSGLQIDSFSFINAALLPLAFLARWLDNFLKRQEAMGAKMPPNWLNTILGSIFGAEAHIIKRMNLPFGLSLLAVVRRQN
jgi:SAM-dependent methyltransferase